MSNTGRWPSKKNETRIILILQADKAYWFYVVNGQLVDSHEQCMTSESGQPVLCPWSEPVDGGEPVLVELVLDTTLDEVDRVSVEQSSSAFVNWYRKFITLTRLRRDYQQASVNALPQSMGADVAAVLHHAIPEQWTAWLLALQSNKLVFHRVATGSEAVACWSRRFRHRVLLVMRVGGYERHMLTESGSVVFLRTVPVNMRDVGVMNTDSKPIHAAISQSLEYLGSVLSLDADTVAIVKPRFSFSTLAVDAGRITPAKSVNVYVADEVSLLLALVLGLDIDCDTSSVHGEDVLLTDRQASGLQGQHPARPKTMLMCSRLSEFLFCKQAGSARHANLRRSSLRWINALGPSVSYSRISHRLMLGRKVSRAIALAAVIAVLGTLFDSVVSKRQLQREDLLQAGVRSDEQQIYSAAAAMVERPEPVADSLILADELAALDLMSPESLLEKVATVLTAIAGVQLERLAWMIIRRDNPYDTLTNLPGSVLHRQTIHVDRRELALQLELSGHVTGRTLNEQQVLLKEFVLALSSLSGVSDVKVLESPLDMALSSDSDITLAAQYRVSLLLTDH